VPRPLVPILDRSEAAHRVQLERVKYTQFGIGNYVTKQAPRTFQAIRRYGLSRHYPPATTLYLPFPIRLPEVTVILEASGTHGHGLRESTLDQLIVYLSNFMRVVHSLDREQGTVCSCPQQQYGV